MLSKKSPTTAKITININNEISVIFFLPINKYAGYTQEMVKKITRKNEMYLFFI